MDKIRKLLLKIHLGLDHQAVTF